MVASNYLATRSGHEQFDQAEAVRLRHIKAVPEGEREEVSEILRGLGIAGDLLGPGVAAITAVAVGIRDACHRRRCCRRGLGNRGLAAVLTA
jgi:hypothetical protein